MPRIFDNIEQRLLDALQDTLKISERADFCVGYFNLRGWQHLDRLMEHWQGGDQALPSIDRHAERPEDELRKCSACVEDRMIDQSTVVRLKQRMAQEFRQQLLVGRAHKCRPGRSTPPERTTQISKATSSSSSYATNCMPSSTCSTARAQQSHNRLSRQQQSHPGGTFQHQGELNVDVMDTMPVRNWRRGLMSAGKIAGAWISPTNWPRSSMKAGRATRCHHPTTSISRWPIISRRKRVPGCRISASLEIFKDRLFDYQVAAVKIAAHHLNKRGGVLIGDVVGLGKTLMATALARIMQDDFGMETLVICPKNLIRMWQQYMDEYGLVSKVISVTNVQNELPDLRRFRLVVIDESHNLRNREGKRYKAIKDYIEKNESKCILLSATPYNKSYLDLSAQLRLFLSDEESRDLGVRPRSTLREIGETTFNSRYQCPVRSLAAFEQSDYADDWRDLMRLFLVRRTRSFIQDNYAQTDQASGRTYLVFSDGRRSYFPARVPRTVKFLVDEEQAADPYATLYSDDVVQIVNGLNLPRYGLANYIAKSPKRAANLRGSKATGKSFSRRETPDGLLSHQPVQTPGERRTGLHPVRRATHPAQLRLPACHRSWAGPAAWHPGRGAARRARQR